MARPTIPENDPDWYAEGEALLDYLESATVTEAARATAAEAAEAARAVAEEAALQAAIDAAVAGSGGLVPNNNLSDVADIGISRDNLGLGDIATQNAGAVAITGGTISGIAELATQNDLNALATLDDLNAVSAAVFDGIPYDPTETVPSGSQRIYNGGIWEALVDVPAGLPPLGIGNGALRDQALLVSRAAGFARWVTGGFGKTVFTVANDNDTGAGSLRAQIAAAQAEGGGWIVFDRTFDGGDGAGVYKILLGSYLQIAGAGAWDITIDGRGCDVTIDGGGAPGLQSSTADTRYPGATVGTAGYAFIIGGYVYTDFNADGNTTPAHNIIVHNIKFISNFGGEESSPGDFTTHRVVQVQWWSRGVWFDHCSLTNPNKETDSGSPYFGRRYVGGTDGLFEGAYGATEITLSWSHLYEHYKAWIIIDDVPPISQAPTKLAPGVTLDDPGPYELAVSPNTEGGASSPQLGDVINLVKVSAHHNHFEHIWDRQPYVKGFACHAHLWNNHHDEWGGYTPDANVHQTVWPDFVTDGTPANQGSATRLGHLAQVLEENGVFSPFIDGVRAPLLAFHTTDGSPGYLRTNGNLLEPLTSGACTRDVDRLPGNVFTPAYGYSLDTADSTLKARIAAGAGAANGLWAYVGPGTVKATFDVQDAGIEIGPGATVVPATTLNLAGSGRTVTWDSGTATVTDTILAGAVDPTDFLLVGTALPTATVGYLGKRFRVVDTLDAPTTGVEYECRHNTGLNVYEWQQVSVPEVPPVLPGQQLAHLAYHPTSQQTTCSTTVTTLTDLTAAAITASWTTIATAAGLDVTFTVPPNRVVLVQLEALMQSGGSKDVYFGLASVVSGVATTITNSQSRIFNSSIVQRCIYQKRLDNAVLGAAGTSFTIRPQWCTAAASTGLLMYVGGAQGPFRIQVFASL